jgi:hypothetical protein
MMIIWPIIQSAIVNRLRLTFLILFVYQAGFSQVKVNKFLQSSSIEILSDAQKIPVVIFINDSSTDVEKANLLSILSTSTIDYDSLDIILNYITPIKICPPNKKLIINGYDQLPGSFIFEPYLILIGTENNNARRIFKNRIGLELEENENYNTRNSDQSPFYKIKSLEHFYKLIRKDFSPKVLMADNKAKIDSLGRNSHESRKTKHSYKIGFNLGVGAFLTQYKNSTTTYPGARQTFDALPTLYDFSLYLRKNFKSQYFYKIMGEIKVFNNPIEIINPNYVIIDQSLINGQIGRVTPLSPIANTTLRHFGLGIGLGVIRSNIFKGFSFLAGADVSLGKTISNGSADFFIQTEDKTLIVVRNRDYYTNKYSLFTSFYASIEKALTKKLDLSLGLATTLGYSAMPIQPNYVLVNNKAEYYALEKTSEQINFQGLAISVGLLYNIEK